VRSRREHVAEERRPAITRRFRGERTFPHLTMENAVDFSDGQNRGVQSADPPRELHHGGRIGFADVTLRDICAVKIHSQRLRSSSMNRVLLSEAGKDALNLAIRSRIRFFAVGVSLSVAATGRSFATEVLMCRSRIEAFLTCYTVAIPGYRSVQREIGEVGRGHARRILLRVLHRELSNRFR